MKSILKLTTVAFFMFVTMSGKAYELKPHLIAAKNEKSVVLRMDAQPEGARVKLITSNSDIIYSESIRIKNVFNKKFDLNTLEDGNYFMEIENPLKKITYTICIKNNTLSVCERKEIAKPYFKINGNRLFINHLNLGKKEIMVSVTDSYGHVLFETTFKDVLVVEKSLNFMNLNPGTYRVFLTDVNNTYSKGITIE